MFLPLPTPSEQTGKSLTGSNSVAFWEKTKKAGQQSFSTLKPRRWERPSESCWLQVADKSQWNARWIRWDFENTHTHIHTASTHTYACSKHTHRQWAHTHMCTDTTHMWSYACRQAHPRSLAVERSYYCTPNVCGGNVEWSRGRDRQKKIVLFWSLFHKSSNYYRKRNKTKTRSESSIFLFFASFYWGQLPMNMLNDGVYFLRL